MRITLKSTDPITRESLEQECVRPAGDPDYVMAPRCPACGLEQARIRGENPMRSQDVGDDTVIADARCLQCMAVVGLLVAQFSTIFGLEEDARVLGPNRRWRVY